MPLDQNDLALIDGIVLSRLQALSPPDRGGGIALRQTKRLQKELDKIEVIIDLNKIRFSAQTVQGLEGGNAANLTPNAGDNINGGAAGAAKDLNTTGPGMYLIWSSADGARWHATGPVALI